MTLEEILLSVLPGLLAGAASALGSIGAIRASVRGLFRRVSVLEEGSLQVQRDLGRLEGLCLRKERFDDAAVRENI